MAAAKKTTAATRPPRPTAALDAPDTGVSLDLDALEREDDPGPYSVKHWGKRYVLGDPWELDYDTFMGLNPTRAGEAQLVRILLGEQADDFFKKPMPVWKMIKTFEGWAKHYGMPELGKLGA